MNVEIEGGRLATITAQMGQEGLEVRGFDQPGRQLEEGEELAPGVEKVFSMGVGIMLLAVEVTGLEGGAPERETLAFRNLKKREFRRHRTYLAGGRGRG
jgi:hypothetical protein